MRRVRAAAHWLRNGQFRQQVQAALAQEREQVIYTTAVLTVQNSPYKDAPDEHLRSQGIIIQDRAKAEEPAGAEKDCEGR